MFGKFTLENLYYKQGNFFSDNILAPLSRNVEGKFPRKERQIKENISLRENINIDTKLGYFFLW